jgi:hypothetical protein
VDLGGQPAARAAEPVVVGLDIDPAGFVPLQVPLVRAPAARWCARAIVKSGECAVGPGWSRCCRSARSRDRRRPGSSGSSSESEVWACQWWPCSMCPTSGVVGVI